MYLVAYNAALCQSHAGKQASAKQLSQLSHLITQIHPALSNLKRLHIVTPKPILASCSQPESIATRMFLLPLSYLFPLRKWLLSALLHGPRVLQVIGCNFPHLDVLQAITTRIVSTILIRPVDVLCKLFLSLVCRTAQTSTLPQICQPTSLGGTETQIVHTYESVVCSILHACPRLTSFVHRCTMSSEVWAALPSGLQACITESIFDSSSYSTALPIWPQKSSVICMAMRGESSSLRGLSILLAAAPCLKCLIFYQGMLRVPTWTVGDLSEYIIADLSLVNDRMQAGLEMYTTKYDDSNEEFMHSSMEMCFEFHLVADHASYFMTAGMQPLAFLAHMVVYCHNMKVDVLQLTRSFPGLRILKLSDTLLDGKNLLTLGSCTNLVMLWLEGCSGVTCAGAAAMCASSCALELLDCQKCRDINAAEGLWRGRDGWGRSVRVFVRECGLDEEWTN